MRTATIGTARAAVVLLLAAAIVDVPLPAASRARVRIHLVDRSDSVRAKGPPDSLTPENADEIAAWDRDNREPGDTVLRASFGADLAFESNTVDTRETDIEGALAAALARNPTEIVLHTDGRADPGGALLLCRARGVPVHVFPIGPPSVRDARLSRVSAPPDAAPGEEVAVEVTVEATFTGPLRLTLDGQPRDLAVTAGVPAPVLFRVRAPARFDIRLEPDDACPRNNRAAAEILARADRRRVLVLSKAPVELPGIDAATATVFTNPEPYDAVIVNDVTLRPEDMRALAAYVRDFGGGLLLMGGPNSFAYNWKGTPIDEISPLGATPDERVAVAFAIDSSGSMNAPGKLDAILDGVQAVLPFFDKADPIIVLAFTRHVTSVEPDKIRTIRAGGETYVAQGMIEGCRRLEQAQAGRKHLFVLTDGEVAPEEKSEERKAAADKLRESGIGLTVVTTNKKLEVGTPVKIKDWGKLKSSLLEILHAVRGDSRENPGTIELKAHPTTAGVTPVEIPWINRTSLRDGAQLAASVGRAPFVDPVVAFRETGRGRAAAFAFPYDARLELLYLQAIKYVAAAGAEGLSLSVDPPTVRARGRGPLEIEAVWRAVPSEKGGALRLRQAGLAVWEGTLPALPPGTVFVRAGRARTAATVPCAREDESLGVDRRALERIAEETGGKVLGSSADLRELPRPSLPGRRSGRPFFLAAAIALLLGELALSTFWKT